jgi:hypothetical protein
MVDKSNHRNVLRTLEVLTNSSLTFNLRDNAENEAWKTAPEKDIPLQIVKELSL